MKASRSDVVGVEPKGERTEPEDDPGAEAVKSDEALGALG